MAQPAIEEAEALVALSPQPGAMELGPLAEALFADVQFVGECERAMGAQLQRTRDGATDKTRIAELAGAVISCR